MIWWHKDTGVQVARGNIPLTIYSCICMLYYLYLDCVVGVAFAVVVSMTWHSPVTFRSLETSLHSKKKT